MKKVITILAVVFCTIVLTSCTDASTELNERIENEKRIELQLIENGEIGDDQEDDQRER